MPKNHTVLAFLVVSLLASSIQSSAGFDAFNQPKADVSPVNLEVIGSISMSKSVYSIAIDDWANRIYVGTNDSLIVINGETDTITAEIPTNETVNAIAVNPRTSRVYIGTSTHYPYRTTVFDGATNLKVGEITQTIYDQDMVAVNPITNLLYIADSGSFVGEPDSVEVWDGENFNQTASVAIPESSSSPTMESIGLSVNPNTNKIFVTWTGSSTLSLIDGDTNTLTKTVHPTSFDRTVMVNSYTNYVYVGRTVLNGENLEEVTSDLQYEIEAIDSPHNLLFAASDYSVFCLDGSSHAVRDSLKLETYLGSSSLFQRMIVNPYTSKLYIRASLEDKIYVIGTGASPLPTPSPTPSPSPSPTDTPTATPTTSSSTLPTSFETASPTRSPSESATASSMPTSEVPTTIYVAIGAIVIIAVAAAAAIILRKRRK